MDVPVRVGTHASRIRYIQSQNRFTEARARYYFQQLIEGVEYCHSQGVIHRDLKPENLLLDENMNLKVRGIELSSFDLWPRVGRPGYGSQFCFENCSDIGLRPLRALHRLGGGGLAHDGTQ